MTNYTSYNFKQALDEVSANSAGGSPFLISYGITFFITAVLSLFMPRETVALIAMFQGGIALPVAFWLERRMGSRRMAAENPLKQLSGQLAFSQALGLPALILVYSLSPNGIPLALASLGGVHFLPYAWLHRTQAYFTFAFVISIGAFVLQLLLKGNAFTYILFFMALSYWIVTPLVYRNAARLVNETS